MARKKIPISIFINYLTLEIKHLHGFLVYNISFLFSVDHELLLANKISLVSHFTTD